MRDAPQIIREKIIGDQAFEEVKNRWLELNKPDQFKRVRTVSMALSLFEHNTQTAEKIIAKASGVPFTRDLPLQHEIEAKMARRAS